MTGNPQDWKVRLLLEAEKPLTTSEVAAIFHVDPRTVGRWADRGMLELFRTGGGHRRFTADSVRKLCLKLGLSPKAVEEAMK
jgi:excisionase family DNA binding protein